MKLASILAIALMITSVGITDAAPVEPVWFPAAPGGGGCFRGPEISPHDSNVILCGNDMGGAFRTGNDGENWELLPFDQIRSVFTSGRYPHNSWCFHPSIAGRVFVGTNNGFRRSDDSGKTWSKIPPILPDSDQAPRVIQFDTKTPEIGYLVFRGERPINRVAIYKTTDSGNSWNPLSSYQLDNWEDIVNLGITYDGRQRILTLATETNLIHSHDEGQTWQPAINGLNLPQKGLKIYDLAPAGQRLYLTIHSDTDATGIYRSDDHAANWSPISGNGLYTKPEETYQYQRLATSDRFPDHIYVTFNGPRSPEPIEGAPHSNVFYSTDGGENWQPILFQHPNMDGYNITNRTWGTGEWGWAVAPFGIDMDPNDPEHVIVTTITSVFLSNDAGRTWAQVQAEEGSVESQPTGGMMMFSVWNYYFNPHNHNNHVLASTDFAGWQSRDSGQTWSYEYKGNPWHHNIYAMAFSLNDPQKRWAASSKTHDIPTWRYQEGMGTYNGGIAFSEDNGKTWSGIPSSAGLPHFSVTDIWLDPIHSNAENEVLWAAVPGHGAYRSGDSGQTWEKRINGIDEANLQVLRISGGPEGTIYAMTTINATGEQRIGGKLYSSDNEGQSWHELLSIPYVPFLTNFTIDPSDSNTLYVCAAQKTQSPHSKNGGIWKSTDKGQTWTKIHDKPTFMLAVHPEKPNELLMVSWEFMGDGIHHSSDGGHTWEKIRNYPFWRALQIIFDPMNADIVYVTNFGGGVYKANCSELWSTSDKLQQP
ncbi:YCF48-related protein [Coraliomargarita sp. SDUM461004]|uniref:YCF48-related protein n=1 Tax=Thalassobacterium sedimentorum TaxID=3041258 RepID=A0ABU1AJW7_9BACT|nr:YCF48-related protein [Coraliomargarita sp. SDUM461004]MDQ8194046.1 YCF48-related protein [Coraliomargarita sp. SDUM461004]